MITSIELASIVYKMVLKSDIKTVINGEVYLAQRPLNSTKNDVVIKALSVSNTELQESVVTVVIYAKNLLRNNTYLPDLKTLKTALNVLQPLFDDVYLPEYQTNLDIEYVQDYEVQEQEAREWASVIRLKTRTINVKKS